MASEDPSSHLAESGITMHSDSEQYSPGEELSPSPPSSGSPIILYKPPTLWSLLRGAAINLLLPFINGMMLGFGELFAHEAAFRLGWGGTKVFPMTRRRAHPIGPGIEVQERRRRPGPSLDDLARALPFYHGQIGDAAATLELGSAPGERHLDSPSLACHSLSLFCSPRDASQPSNYALWALNRAAEAAPGPMRGTLVMRPCLLFILPHSSLSQRLGHGRRLSSWQSSQLSGLTSPTPFRARNVTGPIVLGGVAASRQFSLWGFGKKKTPEENAPLTSAPTSEAASTSTSTSTSKPESAVPPADPKSDNVLPTPPTEPATSTTDIDFSSISDIVNGQDILNMPEQIGYLSALGLDFGWGPTSVMQWTLEHVHIYSGLGWGASIMATAVLLRCLMFYPQIRSLKFNALMQELRKDPRSQEAMKLIQQGFQNGDMQTRQKGQYINKMLKEQYGVSNLGMLWSFGQIPFTFGLFRIVSGMTNVPVPALENAGYLWFSDLTATDPYFILPAAGTALMIGALAKEPAPTQINAKNTPEQQKKMLKTMTYIFGVVGFIGTSFLSAAVNLMTVAIGAATLLTAIVLNNPIVRHAVRLPPLASPPSPSSSPRQAIYEAPRAGGPETGLRERLETNLNDMKKGLTEQFSNYTGTYTGTEQDKAEKKRKELIRKLEETRKQQERDEFERKYKSKK
ncbi:hypothetical protein E4U43_008340 [Claviceps pusilla]|uniref:Membrane insertase YidC/Oxa/ALB C-terminal domain-containing protein n=1 Tax=Claviceps pusilla TaxID=123648 RepID=A0A9P7NDB6_9HYPO|nr:hypothetical protein E4U43_008340 [Claviceps pusilla]